MFLNNLRLDVCLRSCLCYLFVIVWAVTWHEPYQLLDGRSGVLAQQEVG